MNGLAESGRLAPGITVADAGLGVGEITPPPPHTHTHTRQCHFQEQRSLGAAVIGHVTLFT